VSSRVEKVNQWLLLVSHAAIVGGLVLVAVQMNQEMKIAEIQMFNEATSSRIAQQMTMMGENPASIVAKSLTDPDSLTLTELRVMDAYFIAGVNEIRRTEVWSAKAWTSGMRALRICRPSSSAISSERIGGHSSSVKARR
jgi:hypothetical protein